MGRETWWGSTKDQQTRQERAAQPERFDEESRPDDEPATIVHRRPPAKKDTRRWCRGKVGREHRLVIAVPANTWRAGPCGWRTQRYVNGWDPRVWYHCNHVEMCAVCKKVMRRYYGWLTLRPGDERTSLAVHQCPDYDPATAPAGSSDGRPGT